MPLKCSNNAQCFCLTKITCWEKEKKQKQKQNQKQTNKQKRHANLMYKSLTTHLQIARILSKDTLRWSISKNHI